MQTDKKTIDDLINRLEEYFRYGGDRPEELEEYELNYRGRSLKLNVYKLFYFKQTYIYDNYNFKAFCGTYQNYLGGGIAGSIQFGSSFSTDDLLKHEHKAFEYLEERLKKLHYNIVFGDDEDDDVLHINYKAMQGLPASAY